MHHMNQKNQNILNAIRGKLIVSCQALPDESLHSSFIMGRMALAADRGGAGGIRANTVEDIAEIRRNTTLPIIGIIKKDYDDSDIYITPTMDEVDALIHAGVDIIAMDATDRIRPHGRKLDDFFHEVRTKYPDQLFMADCDGYESGMHASEIGFDLIGTTMVGYTPASKGAKVPPYGVLKKLIRDCRKTIIAEGHISTPEMLRHAMDMGVWAVVVGSAITRPYEITKTFVKALEE